MSKIKREPVGSEVRIRAMKRDRFLCTYCGESGNDTELEVDHIIPVSNGGSNHMSNLTTACRKCNSIKSAGELPVGKRTTGLVGLFFHNYNKDSELHWQGYIKGQQDNYFVVELFSWVDGWPNGIELVPVEKFLPPYKVSFYGTSEEMCQARERKKDE